MPDTLKGIQIMVPSAMHKALRLEALERDIPMAELIRIVLQRHLDGAGEQTRASA